MASVAPTQTLLRDRPSTTRTGSWLSEPLVHFITLGALLFALDHFLVTRADDPHTIVVSAEVNKELTEMFAGSRNRQPTPEELKALQKVWLDNEVLYREGLANGLDRGDQMLRDRIIFKSMGLIESAVKVQAPDNKVLESWFQQHRDKYDEVPRISFQEAALSGNSSEAEVQAFVTALNAGTPGDAKAGLRVFKTRPVSSIDQAYGADFAKSLQALPLNRWTALQTRDGWRAICVTEVRPGVQAEFAQHYATILADWKDANASDQRTAAVRELWKKYNIRYEPAHP
jgi:PPIC-type PPIASE domain